MSDFFFLIYVFFVGFYCGLPKLKEFINNKHISLLSGCLFGIFLYFIVHSLYHVPIYKLLCLIFVTWLFRYRYYNPFVSVSITKA